MTLSLIYSQTVVLYIAAIKYIVGYNLGLILYVPGKLVATLFC